MGAETLGGARTFVRVTEGHLLLVIFAFYLAPGISRNTANCS